MVKITREEAEYLQGKGFNFGTNGNGYIHRTFTRKKNYYLTENQEALEALYEYRQSKVVLSVEK